MTDHLPSIVILTGAGISAESGIPTFRAPEGIGKPALWAEHDVEDVATPAGYRRNPELVHNFYRDRRTDVAAAEPNAAHLAVARLADVLGERLLVVTQNIDNLHERAGLPAENLIHMHGSLIHALCPLCGHRERGGQYGATCPACQTGTLRPDVVWFGEQPHQMSRIEHAVQNADMFVAIGTSGEVYPAAGLVDMARLYEVDTIEMNLVRTSLNFRVAILGLASERVPMFVDSTIAALD